MSKVVEEFIKNYIPKSKRLNEMALSWSDIVGLLGAEKEVRDEHMSKLFYYRKHPLYSNDFLEWATSARKGLEKVAKLKNTNKFPSYAKLYEILWGGWEDVFQGHHSATIREVNQKYPNYGVIVPDFDGMKQFMTGYYTWVSSELSKEGHTDNHKSVEKIKELLGLT